MRRYALFVALFHPNPNSISQSKEEEMIAISAVSALACPSCGGNLAGLTGDVHCPYCRTFLRIDGSTIETVTPKPQEIQTEAALRARLNDLQGAATILATALIVILTTAHLFYGELPWADWLYAVQVGLLSAAGACAYAQKSSVAVVYIFLILLPIGSLVLRSLT